MLFGSDYPLIAPERWITAYDEAGFKPEIRNMILEDNALGLLFGKASAKRADVVTVTAGKTGSDIR